MLATLFAALVALPAAPQVAVDDTLVIVQEQRCYVVCYTITAHVLSSGAITRVAAGQRLGPGRRPVPVRAESTFRVGADTLAALTRTLGAVPPEWRDRSFQIGMAPCSGANISHSPRRRLRWRRAGRWHDVSVEMPCLGLPEPVRAAVTHSVLVTGIARWEPAT